MLYNCAADLVHSLPQDVVPGTKHAPGYCLSDWLLDLGPDRYCKGHSLTFDEAVQFVRDFFGGPASGGSAREPTSPPGPLADGGRLDYNGDWNLGDLLTCGAPDPPSASMADFDLLGVACKQVGVAKSGTLGDIVTMAEAR